MGSSAHWCPITDAGVRYVELLPTLRDELAARKANQGKTASDALVFGTASGAPHSPSNIRTAC